MRHLVTAKIQFGESLEGALGRVAQVNGMTARELFANIGCSFQSNICTTANMPVLASLFETTTDKLIRGHTTLLFADRFASSSADTTTEVTEILERRHLLRRSPTHRYCPSCAQEDVDYLGFAFWRIRHNLPGILVCTTHHIALVSTTLSPLRISPAQLIRDSAGTATPDGLVEATSILIRYAQTVETLFEMRTPPPSNAIRRALRSRATELGLNINRRKNGTVYRLGDYAFDSAESNQIRSITHSLQRYTADPKPILDGYLGRPQWAPSFCALIACILLPTLEETTRLLSAPLAHGEAAEPPSTSRYWNTNGVSPKRLTRTYHRCEGNHDRTAAALGISRAATNQYLKARGCPNVKNNTSRNVLLAVQAFESGCELLDACTTYAADPAEVQRLLRQASINLFRCANHIVKRFDRDHTGIKPTISTAL